MTRQRVLAGVVVGLVVGGGVFAQEPGVLRAPQTSEIPPFERVLQPGMVGYGENACPFGPEEKPAAETAEPIRVPRGGAWPILRDWTPAEVRHRAAWFEHLYRMKTEGTARQRTARLVDVLTDPEMNLLLDPAFAGEPCNPEIDEATLRSIHGVLDCAKFAQVMQAYYAFRRGLPWMVSRIGIGQGTNVRFSEFNLARGGFSNLDFPNPGAFLRAAVNGFVTGNLRIEPMSKGWEHTDTVPVALDPRYLLPGTLYYTDGHVSVVSRVDAYGGVYFLDASLAATRDIRADFGHYALTGVTGLPGPEAERPYAECYRGFRIPRWPVAERNAEGKVVRIRRMTDTEMQTFGYSLDQYQVMRELETTGHIRHGGLAATTFAEYVRQRLRTAPEVDPVAILETRASRLLRTAKLREQHVQAAWREVQTNGPVRYPNGYSDRGIFSAPGRWGTWSTAVMDVGLRGEYFDLLNVLSAAVSWYENMPETVNLGRLSGRHGVWSPADLVRALRIEKRRIFDQARFTCKDSHGSPVEMSLLDLEARIFDLSFDPNHPPEVRWGMAPGRPQTSILPETTTPLRTGGDMTLAESYSGQAYYRTLTLCEFKPTPLKEDTALFAPMRFDERLAALWRSDPSPPLVPRTMRPHPIPQRRPLIPVYRVAEADE